MLATTAPPTSPRTSGRRSRRWATSTRRHEPLIKEGKLYGLPEEQLHHGPATTASSSPRPASTRTARPRPGPRSGGRQEDRRPRPGHVGFGEYSAGNTGGWHFAASLYGLGGEMVDPRRQGRGFNSPRARPSWRTSSDALDRQQHGRQAAPPVGGPERMMGGGKLGMMIGAPDVVRPVNNDFKGKFEDYGGHRSPARPRASLFGGDGYMINQGEPEKIKAAIAWLDFHELTPGKGQFNYARTSRRAARRPADPRTVRRTPHRARRSSSCARRTPPCRWRTSAPSWRARSSRASRTAQGAGALRDPRRGHVRSADQARTPTSTSCSPTPRRKANKILANQLADTGCRPVGRLPETHASSGRRPHDHHDRQGSRRRRRR